MKQLELARRRHLNHFGRNVEDVLVISFLVIAAAVPMAVLAALSLHPVK